jgi:hypothetical protein
VLSLAGETKPKGSVEPEGKNLAQVGRLGDEQAGFLLENTLEKVVRNQRASEGFGR